MKALGTVIRRTVPYKAGQHMRDLETPCLVVHKDIMERNMRRMQQMMAQFPQVRYRAHAKAHKCAPIAHMQIQHGSHGICCQKVSEAEAMVQGGLQDVFISNEVVCPSKIQRIAELAQKAKISICVDQISNVKELSKAAVQHGVAIDVLLEVNVGQNRCGIDNPSTAAEVAQCIVDESNLVFKGIQAYHGGIQHIRIPKERSAAVDKVLGKTVQFLDAIQSKNIDVDTVTGGGTGTFLFEAASGIYTEVQPGSYIFGDVQYSMNLTSDGQPSPWEQSLFVLSTVTSVSQERSMAVVDAGMKAVSLDSPPVAVDLDAEYQCGGDEHGMLLFGNDVPLSLCDVTKLIPGHCDPTVNNYDVLLPIEDNKLLDVWPIASGPGY